MRRSLAVAAFAVGLVGPVGAQGVDQTDIAFWQSVQASQSPAEYQAYLAAFPNGVFAELAKLRLQQLGGSAAAPAVASPPPVAAAPVPPAVPAAPPATANAAPAADPAIAAAPEPQPDPDAPLSDATLTVTPAKARVGMKMKVYFADLPTPGSTDVSVVVPAGSPASAGTSAGDTPLATLYMYNETSFANGWEIGPFAPGSYEVRWLSTLYNNEKRFEIAAKTTFQVGR
ncbi:hypothetical protein [Mangrovibrevibacter kandeliae]|uniref:hypothetical protein n=1 Tax=Mangrovibrevibacter kandeliae TaxID=2968473 RepID=UPI0021199231|nr:MULTISPECIES: hypothetical protein [unclassified Aurantimonas]MCQ8783594.1 hypothetical protein [Aurantimonas sp. CSK15Z-1]MCW4116446.1 hypothetical protein [Aurantimonas sp. MSK8Z-1]